MTMTPTQRAAAERLAEFERLPRKLLDIACRVRVNECLFHDDEFVDDASHTLKEALALLRELLAEPRGEPVAWRSKTRINNDFDSNWCLTSTEPPQTPRTIAIEPLYIHPPQQRKPLTKVQITELAEQCGYDGAVPTVRLAFQGFKLDDFARAVERAHGIVEAP